MKINLPQSQESYMRRFAELIDVYHDSEIRPTQTSDISGDCGKLGEVYNWMESIVLKLHYHIVDAMQSLVFLISSPYPGQGWFQLFSSRNPVLYSVYL